MRLFFRAFGRCVALTTALTFILSASAGAQVSARAGVPDPGIQANTTPTKVGKGLEVRVNGLRRVSEAAFLNSLTGVVRGDDGSTHTTREFSAADTLRELYATGLYQDIALYTDPAADRLRFALVEYPVIDRVSLSGNDRIPTEALNQALDSLGVVEGQSYQPAVLATIRRELESQYAFQGRYNAGVDVSIDPLPQNRVAVIIEIDEGRSAPIRSISVRGNQTFTADEILNDTRLRPRREADPLQLFSRRYEYNRQAWAGDLETINSFYFDRGYVRFSVEDSQVSLEPDLSGVHLMTDVVEGKRYRWGRIAVSGAFAGFEDEIRAAVTPQQGDWFNRSELVATQDAILNILGDDGYLFARAEPRASIDDAARTVDLELVVDPGPQVTVRTIRFTGNQGTLDEVLRREMRVYEGGLARRSGIATSRRRLQQLGFFSSVSVEEQRVSGAPDQVDLEFRVVEDKSGNIQASVGYQVGVGLFSAIQFSQNNFLGSGKRITLNSQFGQDSTVFNLSHYDPYFTQTGISRDLRVFYERTNWLDRNVLTYGLDRLGGEFVLGAPLTDNSRLSLGLGYTEHELYTGDYPPLQVTGFAADYGSSYADWSTELAWSYDNQIGSFYSTEGQRHRVALKLTLPGSDLGYYRLTYRGDRIWPLQGDDLAFRLLGQAGYGSGYGAGDSLPFYQNFYAGGPGSVRGFREQSLSPKGEYAGAPPITPRPVGGDTQISTGAELIVPTPFVQDQSIFRTALFVDAGGALNSDQGLQADSFRASAGVDFVWRPIPMLPLRFIVSRPLVEEADDAVESFKFTFWSNF